MPFKSKAQRRKFAELLVKGEISPETFEEWNRETGGADLPERAGKPKRGQGKRAARTKTTARRSARKSTRKSARKVIRKSARKTTR